jgi:hypothetical protein
MDVDQQLPDELRAAALQLHAFGANVLPIPAGKKGPNYQWKQWRTQRQTTDDVRQLMWKGSKRIPAAAGVGIVNGINGFRTFDLDTCLSPSATLDQLLSIRPAKDRGIWYASVHVPYHTH